MIDNLMSFDELLDENLDKSQYYGFIYITFCNPEDKMYIGKKVFKFTRNVKLGKKELALLPKTRGRQKLTISKTIESDWKTYYGSHPIVKGWVKKYKPEDLSRGILKLCKTKKELTYFENKYLYSLGVIEPGSKFVNDNISGTMFTKDFN